MAFKIKKIFDFLALKNHFPCSPAGGSVKRNEDATSTKTAYMSQRICIKVSQTPPSLPLGLI